MGEKNVQCPAFISKIRAKSRFKRDFGRLVRDPNATRARVNWSPFYYLPMLHFGPCPTSSDQKYRLVLTYINDTYGLLTKCEVKMAGYWPSSFFACLWTETKSRSINSQKKNEANIQSSYRTNLVNKGFIIWLLVKFCLRDTAGGPERARWLHLARSGSQSQRAIWFILPAHGASHIIICNKALKRCTTRLV